MKIRSGFVSNSSSSSFIVIFPSKPETVEEVKDMLFPDKEMDNHIFHYDYSISVEDACNTVLNDINDGSKEQIIKELKNNYNYNTDNYVWKELPEDSLKRFEGFGSEFFNSNLELTNKIKTYGVKEVLLVKKTEKLEEEVRGDVHNEMGTRPDYKDREAFQLWSSKFNEKYKKHPNYKKLQTLRKKRWKPNPDLENLIQQAAEADYDKIINDNPNSLIAWFSYSDNDGSFGCVIEHGEIFDNLIYKRISHH